MKVKDLTVLDVIKHPLFLKNIENIIEKIKETRIIARTNGALKRHPIDHLQERHVFIPEEMTVLYAKAIDKDLKGYSSSERKFVLEVGDEAFKKTMKQLIAQENEAARN